MKIDFYEQSFNTNKDEIFIKLVDEIDSQEIRTGYYTPEGLIEGIIDEGSKSFPILRLQDPFNFLISEHLLNKLLKENITGWTSFEVNIEGIDEKYFCFQITGKSGSIERPNKAGFITGMKFDLSTWDGSDLFIPEGTMTIFCTKKVKVFFEKNKITNIEFNNIESIRWYNA